MFDPRTQKFVELDESREFPIDDEDGDAGAGLATALLIGCVFWGCVALAIFEPWSRPPLASIGFVILLGLVIFASRSIADRWRDAHPENPVVDWLRRSGL